MEGDIIILQLRQYGFDFVGAELTPAEFTTELLYAALLQGLQQLGILTPKEIKKRFPSNLPKATAARFAIAQSLVSYLQAAGFTAVGYDALVYPAEASTKIVLQWLVAELGKVAEAALQRERQQIDDDESGHTRLHRNILNLQLAVQDIDIATKASTKLMPNFIQPYRRKQATYHPYFAVGNTVSWAEEVSMLDQIEPEYARTVQKCVVYMDETPKPPLAQAMLDTISEANSVALLSSKAIQKVIASLTAVDPAEEGSSSPPPTFAPKVLPNDDTLDAALFFNSSEAGLAADPKSTIALRHAKEAKEEAEVTAAVAAMEEKQRSVKDREAQREEDEANLRKELHAAKRALREKQGIMQALQSEVEEERARLAALREEFKERECEAQNRLALATERQQLLSLMDDSEGSEIAIQQRIYELKEKRRAQRDDLNNKLAKVDRKREQLLEESNAAGADFEERLTELRGEIKAIRQMIKSKTREVKALEADYAKCPKEIDRSGFLRLIFDMTANIRKQHQQLEKVRQEIAGINECIAELEKKIAATFAQIEEKVYSAAGAPSPQQASSPPTSANKPAIADEFARQAYKNVVELQDSYSNLIECINKRGIACQELHEVEEKQSKLSRIVGGYNLEQMKLDLEAVEGENHALAEQLDSEP